MAKYVGVDLGGTKIAAALVNELGEIQDQDVIPTEANKGSKRVIQNIISAIESVWIQDVRGIGLGSPGPLDPLKGIIKNPGNLPFRNTRLKEILWDRFRTKVRVDNDARVYALGEARFGAGKGFQNVIVVTLGTGLGTGFIINGQLYHGRGNAGEAGHMSIDFNGPNSRTNKNNGDAELYLGTQGILSRCKGLKVKNVLDLAELAKKNKKARKVWDETGVYLGVFLANLTYAFDPDILIVGGSISKSWNLFEKKTKQTLKERMMFPPPKVVKAKLGGDAPLIGAASLVIE